MGKHGRAQGPRRRAAHGGIRREDEGIARQPRDPHPFAGLMQRGMALARNAVSQGGTHMSKSRQTRETARTMVSPLFAWNAAVLKGGEMMLDSMAAAAKNVRVAVLDADTPRSRPARKAAAGRSKAKRARRR